MELNHSELSVLLTTDREIQKLNREYRKKDKPTDVLSFPTDDESQLIVGDVVISIPTLLRQAKEYDVTPREEFLRLLIHGTLHLLGHDHEGVSAAKAQRMRRAERKLFETLHPEL